MGRLAGVAIIIVMLGMALAVHGKVPRSREVQPHVDSLAAFGLMAVQDPDAI